MDYIGDCYKGFLGVFKGDIRSLNKGSNDSSILLRNPTPYDSSMEGSEFKSLEKD